MIAKHELEPYVDVRQAKYSMVELERAHASIRHGLKGSYDSQINEKANQVELFVLDSAGVDESVQALDLDLPDHGILVTVVEELSIPTAAIYGGLHTSPCTIGFAVKKNGSSTLGVANAAHCTEPITYAGTTLDLQNQDQDGDDDTAWYTTPGYTPDNVISTDSDTAWERQITSTVSRTNQPIGYTACKYGKSSGYDCGTVTSRTLAPGYIASVVAVFMRLDCGVNDCSDPGDSGGPVFKATGTPTSNTAAAVGIISGAIGPSGDHDVIYMAANYISGVGADVLTS